MMAKRLNHNLESLVDAVPALEKEGYTIAFSHNEKGFYDPESGKTYLPESIEKAQYIRLDAPYSEPDAQSILYLLETVDGQKGWISDAYGYYADDILNEHIQRIKENFSYTT